MSRVMGALSLLAALVAVAPAAPGTTYVRELSARQLGERATAVVRGEVTGVRSFWNEGRTKIFTEVEVRADETYKGSPGGTVTLLQLGGVVGNVRVTVHGALQWQAGEEVLLFLEPASRDRLQVAGFSQGKLSIERDPVTGEAFVRQPSPSGVALVGDGEKAGPDGRPARIPLQKFIREALADGPQRERQ